MFRAFRMIWKHDAAHWGARCMACSRRYPSATIGIIGNFGSSAGRLRTTEIYFLSGAEGAEGIHRLSEQINAYAEKGSVVLSA